MDVYKLILAIVQTKTADATIHALNEAGLAVTLMASVGGFLGASNVTLLIGLRAGDVEKAMDWIKIHNPRHPVRDSAGTQVGATVFILPVERYMHARTGIATVDWQSSPSAPGAMKMILAVVCQAQSDRLVKTLTDWSYRTTLMSTTGAFLRRRNATLLVVARSERVDSIVDQIRQTCSAGPPEDSATTVFVLDNPRTEHM